MAKCVYLDHGATSWPKPQGVVKAINDALTSYGANPGRGAYTMALAAAKEIFMARERVSKFFNAPNPQRVVFTSGTTESLNFALYGLLEPGDHLLYSPLEHNGAWRPIMALEKKGIQVEMIPVNTKGMITAGDVERLIRPNTKMVVCVHASNITGTIQPIAEIGAVVRKYQALFLVDVAQTAGILPVDVTEMHIDLLAVPGHKGLYGPMGTGILYVGERISRMKPLKQGGTGSQSHSPQQPENFPDLLECGTANLLGIAGVKAGIEWLERQGLKEVQKNLAEKIQFLLKELKAIPGVQLYGPPPGVPRATLVAINLAGVPSNQLAFILDKEYGIAVRAGFHCSPLGHKVMGTTENGAVRFSIGTMTTKSELDYAIKAVKTIAEKTAPSTETVGGMV